jgi:hypothetical protein
LGEDEGEGEGKGDSASSPLSGREETGASFSTGRALP